MFRGLLLLLIPLLLSRPSPPPPPVLALGIAAATRGGLAEALEAPAGGDEGPSAPRTVPRNEDAARRREFGGGEEIAAGRSLPVLELFVFSNDETDERAGYTRAAKRGGRSRPKESQGEVSPRRRGRFS